jgi:hypothetical protein
MRKNKRSKRHRYISEGTLKSLQKLSYNKLKNLSSEELQKYKRRVGIIEQEQAPEPYTDEDLIRMLRKYISGKKGINKTKQLTWRARQHEMIKRRLLSKNQKGGKKSKEWSPKPGWKLSPKMLKCLREPWSGSVPKKNTKNKMYDCPMFEDRSKSFVLNGPNKAPKIERDHYLLCYKGMYKDCERKSKKGGCASSRGGGKKTLLTRLQIKNMQRLKKCEKTARNKNQKKKCLDEFNKTWEDYSTYLNKNSIRKGRNYADRKQYTPKQQREIMKQFFGKNQKGGKKTFKSEKKQENVDYWKCIKQKENTRPCNKKRSKTLKRLEKKYPKEWSQYQKDFMTNPKLRY